MVMLLLAYKIMLDTICTNKLEIRTIKTIKNLYRDEYKQIIILFFSKKIKVLYINGICH
jgi:hypothetical protein